MRDQAEIIDCLQDPYNMKKINTQKQIRGLVRTIEKAWINH
jgi:hypothetical protein